MKFYSKTKQERIIYYMRMIYGFMGGFYYSSYYNKRTKCIWTVLTVSTWFMVFLCCIGYLITTEKITIYDVIYTIYIWAGITTVIFIIPYFTYCFRNEFENIILMLENDFNFTNFIMKINTGIDIEKKLVRVYFLFIIFIIPVNFLNILDILIFYEESSLQDIQHYLFPIPFIANVKSIFTFLLIFCNQLMIAIICHSIYVSTAIFFSLLTYSVFNCYIRFSETIKKMSEKMVERDTSFLNHLIHVIRGHQMVFK